MRFPAWVAGRLHTDRGVDLVRRDDDVVHASNLTQHQAEADAAGGDSPVFLAQLIVGFNFIVVVHRAVGAAGFEILPDLVEFLIDERFWWAEGRVFGQYVQQIALQPQAGQFGQAALTHGRQRFPQVFQRVKTQFFGQRIVDGRSDRLAQLLCRDIEGRQLSRQVFRLVFGGEGHFDDLRFTGLHALDLFDEARDEVRAADIHIRVSRGAPLEGHAVNLAQVVDGQDIAFRGAGVVAAGCQFFRREIDQIAVPLGDVGDRFIQLFHRHFGDVTGQGEGREIRQRDFRQQLQLQFEFQIGCRASRRGIGADQFQFRLHRRAQRPFRHQLLG